MYIAEVNCGYPGYISHGKLHGSTFTYGRTVRYTCDSGYLLVGGSFSRRCQLSALWSGRKPRCAYYNSCASGPCKNRATCTNIPDHYQCTCTHNWSGKNCDVDIQPPVMMNCSVDKYITTEAIKNLVNWQIPSFTDPHNFAIKVTSNYPSNEFTFPWGDFKVSYTAIKPTNGFSTNCLFSIRLRQSYTVPRGVMMGHFYVCGASGTWMPSNTIPNCSVTAINVHATGGYRNGPSYLNCTGDRKEMQEDYIDKLSHSHFRHFCKNSNKNVFQKTCQCSVKRRCGINILL
ncbi:unnamed protein product [Mytilus edulis]|uniref:Uncharacterized protein n=1 Tax=Mytilus edulis TaxID=6550 RepID=A0A8S3V518_MYTED|nr:unnamed protein product [Mytilus edulis]